MTNIVLCFDEGRPSLVTTLSALLDDTQSIWCHDVPRRRRAASDEARIAITEGYRHLVRAWQPGDEIFVFGAGRGAACAQALSRLLGTIGVLDGELIDYMLATYAVPRTPRSGDDWRSIAAVAAGLTAQSDIAVPVRFLGLWDATRTRGTAGPVEVVEGRHAIAIDGGPLLQRVQGVEEVWFRGTHRGILTDALTLDWMLDGATRAGLRIGTDPVHSPGTRHDSRARGVRRLPDAAAVHASVEQHVRTHPAYWRRLPAEVVWTDIEWLDRTERLVQGVPRQPIATQALAAAS
ncbi:uncharacterized protein RMCC_4176 [Mycolicibacterium canariasense]|uniref:T6SS Phospholipase effector Tle1-like catalytic domain-containing protein n=1 Tax=Mycolicibacterium canariasense TaxID=228230 RepID=A0A100WFJ6_MYCCR|nr:DUF2235 domain-containing protein [Mycolicibacterium canariasense]MCV7211218.1 DUF2235 domain-containing protein [Mycolicibacterium canariasense]ORV03277.1 hypothetical protein AWB94_24535 [Mycolicibacterium canariasense]GAS97210.1 uncharacterized protein RMCC_4176 [Mycolicibacterium canariasense]